GRAALAAAVARLRRRHARPAAAAHRLPARRQPSDLLGHGLLRRAQLERATARSDEHPAATLGGRVLAPAPERRPAVSDVAAAASTKVVFVMGSGHSGSTILGVTLGNCDGFFYAGELDNWLTRSGVSALGGRERTRFWSEVRKGVPDAPELFGYRAQEQLE